MSRPENDDLLLALGGLADREPGADRSHLVVREAMRAIARRRRLAERRVVMRAAMYAGAVAPFAAGSLSAAYLVAALVQAIAVLRHATPGAIF